MNHINHIQYMSLALELAARGRFTVSPNPMVGCVIVKNNHVIGEGYHKQAGGPHAEVFALQAAGEHARDAVAYVTLEPCCHYGRTPPCIDALITAGIKSVYVACLDPNPLVAGKGVAALRQAGMEVNVGLCEQEAQKLNEIFFHYITHKRPYVIAKWAMSLDGLTITHPTDSPQISSMESMQHTHQLRRQVDAILIGANTARVDNPQLTVRYGMDNQSDTKQPVRIVLTTKPLPNTLNIFQKEAAVKTIIATIDTIDKAWVDSMQSSHIDVIVLPRNSEGNVSLPALMNELGKREMTSVVVEGGRSVHMDFFKENLVNKIVAYVSPIIIGSLDKKQKVAPFQISEFGVDLCLTTYTK